MSNNESSRSTTLHDGLVKLEELERRHIITVLQSTGWRVRGDNGAAQILGVKPTTLESKMQRLGIKRNR